MSKSIHKGSMAFQINQDLLPIQQSVKKFCQEKIAPQISSDEEAEKFRPEWIKGLGELGLTGAAVPESFGGSGLGASEFAVIISEIAKASASYAVSVSVSNLAQFILLNFGNDAQK